MVGDAISHAVLPGIVIAFIIAGTRDSVLLLSGAALFGLPHASVVQKDPPDA